MNIFDSRPGVMGTVASKIAYFLILSLILWAAGAPTFVSIAKAANVSRFSDTLSDSAPSHLSKHTIEFTASSNFVAGDTIKIQLDPPPAGSSAFSEAFSSASSSDFVLRAGNGTATTTYSYVASCSAGDNYTVVGNYNGGTDENATFTLCSGATTISSSMVVQIIVGNSTRLWTNPGTELSRVIRLSSSSGNAGDTRVAIINNVVVTASIDTTFTFTIAGLPSGSSFFTNGTTTSTTTSATAISYGTLLPGIPVLGGQQLTVATNARNGFIVTVQEDQPLTSGTGSYIPLFKDGATTSAPTAWTKPTGTLDSQWTYSHFAVTSDDQDLNSGEFSGASPLFAGNIDQPRQVFSHTGPADGTTQNKGKVRVGYEIGITALQAAGNDYTNTLTYVATPTF